MTGRGGFVIEDRPEGRTLIATGPWSDEAAAALKRPDVDGLWLNYARGFVAADLEFLEQWPVRRLLVIDRKLRDLAPISRLAPTLEALTIQAAPQATIDIADLPRLAYLSAPWRQVRETVAHAAHLRELVALTYDERDLRALVENEFLTTIKLKEAPLLESLSGVGELRAVEALAVLRARKLEDISELAEVAATLSRLELEDCPAIDALDDVSGLRGLRFLSFSECGPIASLAPLAHLPALEVVHAWGTTRVMDEDLSPLASLPRLAEIRMRERRGYRPGVGAIQAGFEADRG
jgi:hypothetical protein